MTGKFYWKWNRTGEYSATAIHEVLLLPELPLVSAWLAQVS